MQLALVTSVVVAWFVCSVPASSQPAEPTHDQLAQELRAIRTELAALQARVERLEKSLRAGTTAQTVVLPFPASPAAASVHPAPAPSTPLVKSARQQCAAVTQKGKRCSRLSNPGSAYCWQHGR